MPEDREPPLATINEPKLLKVAQLRHSLRSLCRAYFCGNALATNFFNAIVALPMGEFKKAAPHRSWVSTLLRRFAVVDKPR
jgi:predicted metal-dependent hydrolase